MVKIGRKKLKHQHKKKSAFRDIILGGQDGLVNVLGLSLGLFAAHSPNRLIIVAGLAAGFAEAISMGAVVYTSSLAERDFYLKSRELIKKELEEMPVVERQDIYDIYKAKGFDDGMLESMIDHIVSDKELWVNTILSEDLKLQPVETKGLLLSSWVVAISALLGSFIPLAPFLLPDRITGMLIAVIISGIVLFAVGAYKAVILVGSWWKSGLQILLIGLLCAFAGFLIGMVLKVN